MDAVTGIGLLLIIIVLYFVPTLVARSRDKKNKAAITALNIFLGWTFVGWVISLVWAITKDE